MPRFAANLSMMFTEVPFLDRFERAGNAGFEAVEFLFPYAYPVDDIERRLEDNGLTLVLHNLPAGDWDAGERGIACLPDRVNEFRSGVVRAIEYAKALGVEQVNCLAGKAGSIAPDVATRSGWRRCSQSSRSTPCWWRAPTGRSTAQPPSRGLSLCAPG